jgi:3-oxoacyl-[acyl-carrier-protein] synthase III
MQGKFAHILGCGSYLPEKILDNHDLEKLVDTSDEWIVERSGIKKRHIAADDESCVSMGEMASRKALEAANLKPEDIDLIIVATCTSDKQFPSAACLLQARLGAHQAFGFDISAACTGFIYGLSTAQQFIETGSVKRALVVGSEVLSRATDWTDRATCVLFGDGAGAMVLEARDTPGILASRLHADGRHQDALYLNSPYGVSDSTEKPCIKMQGRDVFRLAVEQLTSAVHEIVEQAGLSLSDIDWVVPHQANFRIIKMISTKLKLPMDRIIVSVDEHANTSSASIPLAFDQAVRSGKIKRGQTCLFEAFGGGLTWGSLIVKY